MLLFDQTSPFNFPPCSCHALNHLLQALSRCVAEATRENEPLSMKPGLNFEVTTYCDLQVSSVPLAVRSKSPRSS